MTTEKKLEKKLIEHKIADLERRVEILEKGVAGIPLHLEKLANMITARIVEMLTKTPLGGEG